jgi:hypothetical protein
MKKTVIILPSLFFVLNHSCNYIDTSTSQRINLREFGIEKTSDATPAVVEAIKKCQKEGIRKLEFPKGTYQFPQIYQFSGLKIVTRFLLRGIPTIHLVVN